MSKTPAVLVCDARTSNLEVAGLTVLDRLVVTAHRAGCDPIFLVCETMPALARTQAMGIATITLQEFPKSEGVALLITGGVVVEPRDLARVIEAGGQLIAENGSPLPVTMNTSGRPPVPALGVACAVTDATSAREAERKLWASLTSSADGLVDRFFNRPLGRPLSKLLAQTPVSPNQVSLLSILIGVASAWFFAAGSFVMGALILQLSAVVDCVDGDLARVLFKQSRAGKWLDLAGDQVVHFSVFAAIGMGVSRLDPSVPALTLGLSAALGVLLSFAVIVRALRQPVAHRRPLLNKLLEATANRDFSVVLLLLAIFGRMDLFLWMAGIGVHVFWIALLILVWRSTRPVTLAFEVPAANLHR